MSDIESVSTIGGKKKSKRIKMTEPPLVLLIIHGFSVSDIQMFVSDHSIFDNLTGFYKANNRIGRFYTDEMHQEILRELGDDIRQPGDDPLSDFSKQSALYELFVGPLRGGRAPRTTDCFTATIIMYIEPARLRFLK